MHERKIYISCNGNDKNDGSSPQSALKTISGAKKYFCSGTEILLESGCVFDEPIKLTGLKKVTLSSYGTKEAVIKTHEETAVYISECSECSIFGLIIEGAGYDVFNESRGIAIEKSRRVTVGNAEVSGFHKAGIEVTGSRDVELTGCFAHDNGFVGICTGADGEGVYCENISVKHCRVYDNAGDKSYKRNHSGSGIIIAGSSRVTVEYCEAAGNGWAQRQTYVNGPVGMWCCCGANDVTFRYNICRNNRTQPGAVDGDGIDIDGESENCVCEYNYTYGNEGSGYLLCEFYGDVTDTVWQNNIIRYCVSVDDACRIAGYGAVNISAPPEIEFKKMQIHNNLLVAGDGLICVYNQNVPETVSELIVNNNVFVENSGKPVSDYQSKAVRFYGNCIISGENVRNDFSSVPRLVEPRSLLKQPVFELLKEPEKIYSTGVDKLFSCTEQLHKTDGELYFELQMYGPDYEGTSKSGDIHLGYDSITKRTVTIMRGKDSEIFTSIPWWEEDKYYIARANARLKSHNIKACLFIRDSEGKEVRRYFNASCTDMSFVELPFKAGDKWYDDGKYIGVRIEDGSDALLLYSLEFLEIKNNAAATEYKDSSITFDFRSFGDFERIENGIRLFPFSRVEKTVYTGESGLSISFSADNNNAVFYYSAGNTLSEQKICNGENTFLINNPDTGYVTYGIKSFGELNIEERTTA